MNVIDLFDAGYESLVSVIPVGAVLSPLSKLKPDDIGKVPGRRNANGQYGGYDWRQTPTRADVERWVRDGNNIGLAARDFPAIDIDCLDEGTSMYLRGAAIERFGQAPVRVGRWPKQLLVFQTAQPFGRMRLWFHRAGQREHVVEVLGDGQQFVIAGMHPFTRRPYEWVAGRALPGLPDLLPVLTRDAADEWLDDVAADLEALGYIVRREGAGTLTAQRAQIDQSHLIGDVDKIRAAVALIPNTNETHPGRDDYLRLGYAIKAGCGPDHEDEALEIFQAWAAKWEGNDSFAGNDPAEVERDFHKMVPPFEVGANFVYDAARPYGFSLAAEEFDADLEPGDETPQQAAKHETPLDFTDAALAQEMAERHAHELRYCDALGGWLVWDGRKWVADKGARAMQIAARVALRAGNRAMRSIESINKAEKVANRLHSNAGKNAIVGYASSSPEFVAAADAFDVDRMLVNTESGIVDLTTGAIRPADPDALMMKCCASTVGTGTPKRWLQFLDETTGGDAGMIAYLQRLAGYCLTGRIDEQALVFIYGTGGNGKGVYLGTIQRILGDYATTAPMETFTASRNEQHPTGLAKMAGARLVSAQETDEGRRWDEPKIKSLTGGDRIAARFMGRDFFEFDPQFKLVIAGNHKPEIRNLDAAIRRRMHLVPFTRTVAKPDTQLADKLRAEWPQILAWMIEGALLWQEHGLNPPEAVVSATQEYFDEEDSVGQWVQQRVDAAPDVLTPVGELFEDWSQWCGENGEVRGTNRRLADALVKHGYVRARRSTDGVRCLRGLRLRAPVEFQADK